MKTKKETRNWKVNPEENLQTLAITFAAYESLESGRVVELK